MRIVVEFRPFVVKQNIIVYDNDKAIDAAAVSIDRVIDVVAGFKNRYGAEEIDLYGNKDYLKKYQESMITKYHKQIPVTIIDM